MLASVGVTISIEITYVNDITSIRKNSTSLEYIETSPTNYKHLHKNSILQEKPWKKTVSYKKYLMSLTQMMNTLSKSGRKSYFISIFVVLNMT